MGAEPGRQPELTPEEIAELHRERISQFADALGLHPDFGAEVQAMGEMAIVNRADMLDETGALGRMLAVARAVGDWMDSRDEDDQPRLGAINQYAQMVGRDLGVPAEYATRLFGNVFEIYQQTISHLARQGQRNGGGAENAQTAGPAASAARAKTKTA